MHMSTLLLLSAFFTLCAVWVDSRGKGVVLPLAADSLAVVVFF